MIKNIAILMKRTFKYHKVGQTNINNYSEKVCRNIIKLCFNDIISSLNIDI